MSFSLSFTPLYFLLLTSALSSACSWEPGVQCTADTQQVLRLSPASATAWSLVDSISGADFNKAFSYEAISDPTHGRVNYVDKATAQRDNLTYASGDHFILRADHKTKLGSTGPGRNSVRLQSNAQYSAHVAVFDIRHMPQGCGTWPAVWELGDDWPKKGELDILEGVNDQGTDQASLHTSPGCTMRSGREMTGTPGQTDCNTAVNSNTGCGVRSKDNKSYGPTFNKNGGGWYAIERTNKSIKVWFWTRDSASVPSDVKKGAKSVDTSHWGEPFAHFPDADCDIASHFGAHRIVINLTFCGDWAGSVYSSSGCPGSCVDYVDNNPSAFTEAYFDFASIKIYT